jgi:hypothetical protein
VRRVGELAGAQQGEGEEASGPVQLFAILVGIFQKDLEIWWKHERTKVGNFPPLLRFILGKNESNEIDYT